MVTSQAQAEKWEVTNPLLRAMYDEVKDLSKKKPDAPLSKGKIKLINRLLIACREVLQGEASLAFLDLLEEDDIPEVSDVALILSQYRAAMEQFREAHFGWNGTEHAWFLRR